MTHIVFVVMLRKPFQHLFKLVFERKGRRPSEISEDGRLRPTKISVVRHICHTSTARLVLALVWQITAYTNTDDDYFSKRHIQICSADV